MTDLDLVGSRCAVLTVRW